MTYANPLSELIESELLLTELWRTGRYLDAVDNGQYPVDADEYQRAARKAKIIIDACRAAERLSALCAMSPALQDIRDTL
jgi:hypothetical protein